MKRLVPAFAVVLALAVGVSVAAAGKPGNSPNAKKCQKNGWQSLYTRDGQAFASETACASYGAGGGQLIPPSALACLNGGWTTLGSTSGSAFANEQACVDYTVGGLTPVALGKCNVKNTNSGVTYTGDGANLISAISAATAGNSLEIKGQCDGNFTITKNLTLTGVATTSYPSATLDGTDTGTVVTVNAGVTAALNSLTITHGSTTEAGGGIRVVPSGTATLTDTTVTDNSAAFGGGISVQATVVGLTTLTLIRSTVSNNSSDTGGGIAIGGINGIPGNIVVTLTDSTVTGNTADTRGGGIDHQNGTLTLTGSTVSSNTARFGGGLSNQGGTSTLVNSTVTLNEALGFFGLYGGGIWNEGTLTLDASTTVTLNTPDDIGSPA